jgi:hypothetical protein
MTYREVKRTYTLTFKLKRTVGRLSNITLFVRTLVEFKYPIEWRKIQFFIFDWNTKGTLSTFMILQDFFYQRNIGLVNSEIAFDLYWFEIYVINLFSCTWHAYFIITTLLGWELMDVQKNITNRDIHAYYCI